MRFQLGYLETCIEVMNVLFHYCKPENGDKRVDYIPGISPMRLVRFPLNDGSCHSTQICLKGFAWVSKAQYLLFTSIYELEPHAIDVLKAELSLPIYTIGPAIPYFSLQNNPTFSTTNGTSHSYMEWLQVLFFTSHKGSHFSVSRAQMDEIAFALRESGIRFLWVGRSEASRLKGICGNKGLVVTWCDQQLRVLSHPSIGGLWMEFNQRRYACWGFVFDISNNYGPTN